MTIEQLTLAILSGISLVAILVIFDFIIYFFDMSKKP